GGGCRGVGGAGEAGLVCRRAGRVGARLIARRVAPRLRGLPVFGRVRPRGCFILAPPVDHGIGSRARRQRPVAARLVNSNVDAFAAAGGGVVVWGHWLSLW